MLINKVDIASIKNQVEAAEHMQDAWKFDDAKLILINLAKDILSKLVKE